MGELSRVIAEVCGGLPYNCNGTRFEEAVHALIKEARAIDEERKSLMVLSQVIDQHPDDYDGACMCKACMEVSR